MPASPIRQHCPKTKLLLFARHFPWNTKSDEPVNLDRNLPELTPRTLSLATGVDQTALKKVCVLSSKKGRTMITASQLLSKLGIPLKFFSMKTVDELTEGSIELWSRPGEVAPHAKSLMTKHAGSDCEVQILVTHLPHAKLLPRHFVGEEGFEGIDEIELEKGDILWVNLDENTYGVIKNTNVEQA